MRRDTQVLLSIYFGIFRFSFLESLKVLESYRSLKVLEKIKRLLRTFYNRKVIS
jgi:hypothetical protein